jgi:pimeloyl-ACP methyl ester carboxylesterase/DNA-binding CsgD family transcriptional regulator
MSQQSQQIRFCKSRDGTRIAYATCGRGPPLVWIQHWIHHLESDWTSQIWQPWLAFLSRSHTVVRYDWRGCGLSDRDRINFSLEDNVADLEAVVAAVGLERFPLFGMAGAGSGVAMSYAVRHREQVICLVLQEAQTKGRIAGDPTPQALQEAQARLKVIELGWPNDTPAYGQFFSALHIPDATAEQARSYNDLLRRVTSPANAIGHLRSFWEADISEIAPQVRCPTLVMHARGDSIIPFDEGRKVASLIPNARFVPIESRNHVLLASEPGWTVFTAAMEEFLSTSSPGPAPVLLNQLTARERDVLEMLAQGQANGEIAAHLGIAEKTVRNHVSLILDKLGVERRSQAIVLAREAGYGRRRPA